MTITRTMLVAIVSIAGALTLAAARPAMSAVQPVNIASCEYSSYESARLPGTTPINTRNLHIAFVNQAPLAATDVRFAVRMGDRTHIVEDAGTFSSGTQVTRDFTLPANPVYNGGAQCRLQSVTFSDGSTWQPV